MVSHSTGGLRMHSILQVPALQSQQIWLFTHLLCCQAEGDLSSVPVLLLNNQKLTPHSRSEHLQGLQGQRNAGAGQIADPCTGRALCCSITKVCASCLNVHSQSRTKSPRPQPLQKMKRMPCTQWHECTQFIISISYNYALDVYHWISRHECPRCSPANHLVEHAFRK